jgi:hypothetical protein
MQTHPSFLTFEDRYTKVFPRSLNCHDLGVISEFGVIERSRFCRSGFWIGGSKSRWWKIFDIHFLRSIFGRLTRNQSFLKIYIPYTP